jgi:peptidoglycan/LPS O-acetylase OafA/YrhL
MEIFYSVLIFIAWSFGAGVCAWLAIYGAKMVKSSQSSKFSLSAKKDELKLNGKFKAGLAIAILGVAALVFLIYSYWKVVYALAVVALVLSFSANTRNPEENLDKVSHD